MHVSYYTTRLDRRVIILNYEQEEEEEERLLTPGPLPVLLTLPATELPSSLSKTGLYSSYARLLYVELKLGLEGAKPAAEEGVFDPLKE